MFKYIKQLIFKRTRTKEWHATLKVYDDALVSIFGDVNKSTTLYRQVVKVIVDNKFMVDIPNIINTFKAYNFTVDEYLVVVFKLGALTQAFVEHPDVILRQAIRMTEVFDATAIQDFQLMLKTLEEAEDIKLKYEYEFMVNSKAAQTSAQKTYSEDDKANKLIENWLKNKKKE